MKAEAEVLHPGLFSTMQDKGRFGFRKYGVPESGPMDRAAAGMANLILQNSGNAAVLEITQQGPKLKFSGSTQIVISGADLSPFLDETSLENNQVISVKAEQILSFKQRIMGCRAYLAIKGGFRTQKILNSRSWSPGITENLRLEKGMKLSYVKSDSRYSHQFSQIKQDNYLGAFEIEVFPGPEFEMLSNAEQENLLENSFSIDTNNNRMGIQLEEKLQNSLSPILTGPVVPGTVQLTPSGKMIVLMRDSQTTGGYPRILQLTEKGMNVLAQKVRGEAINFRFLPEFYKK